jgi:hypothetical protein
MVFEMDFAVEEDIGGHACQAAILYTRAAEYGKDKILLDSGNLRTSREISNLFVRDRASIFSPSRYRSSS